MSLIEELQRFIEKNFHRVVRPDDSLLDAGVLDSVGIFELVAFIEERFRVKVADEEIVPDNFETIERIAALVDRLRGVGAAGREGA